MESERGLQPSDRPTPLSLPTTLALTWEMQQVWEIETQWEHLAIAHRAYELFKMRGGEPGHDWEDWFRAESELHLNE